MREILEQCVGLDAFAADTYRQLADATEDDALRKTLDTLAREELDHVDWWGELLRSYEEGLLPDIVSEPATVVAELERIGQDVRSCVPDDISTLSSRETVACAVQMEFYMLYPLFGELIELVEPAQARKRHAAYARHLDHLIEAVEELAGDDPLVMFLATVLHRVSEDNRELALHATRDALTGVRNRRALDGMLKQWLAWSSRYDRPVGILLADLDSFKAINDGHGHGVGDRVLAETAAMLQETVRGSDLVARYGGDEFVVIAPEADEGETRTLAERLVEAIRTIRVPADGGDVSVTTSVGAAVVESGDEPITPEAVLSAADQSLYEAKGAGKDRVGSTRSVPAQGASR